MTDGITNARRVQALTNLDAAFILISQSLTQLGIDEAPFLVMARELAMEAHGATDAYEWEEHQKNDSLSGNGLQDWISRT